jgi:glucokinase
MKPNGLIAEAARLPRNPDRAVAFPLGASTFRALLVDRYDKIVDEFELKHPAEHHETIAHATAAALMQFGCRPVVGAAFFAGMLPRRGLLEFTNLSGWPKVDPAYTDKLFKFKTQWMNDGTAGYYGLPRLDTKEFAVLRKGAYRQGDNYVYAIFGTGMNIGCPTAREDGHVLFVPKSELDREFQLWFAKRFRHWPEAEDLSSGGDGIRHVAEFFIEKQGLRDEFVAELESMPKLRRAEVVTKYALGGHRTAIAAVKLAFEALGSWLGAEAIAHQATRIDLSPGILSLPELREFVVKKTGFLKAFEDQGRPMFKEFAHRCTVRVCLRNPENEGALERAAELLRARAD